MQYSPPWTWMAESDSVKTKISIENASACAHPDALPLSIFTRAQYCSIISRPAPFSHIPRTDIPWPAHERFVFIMWMQLNSLIDRSACGGRAAIPHFLLQNEKLFRFVYYYFCWCCVRRTWIETNMFGMAVPCWCEYAFHSWHTMATAHSRYIWIVIFIAIPHCLNTNSGARTRCRIELEFGTGTFDHEPRTTHHRRFIFCNCFLKFSSPSWTRVRMRHATIFRTDRN